MAKAKIKGKVMASANEQDTFANGVLLYCEIRMWGANATIDKEILSKIGITDRELLNQISAARSLLTKEGNDLLGQYRTVRNETKSWIYRNSLPFPVDGFVFVPKSQIERVDNYLKQRQEEAQMIVDTIVPMIKKLEADYAAKFPALYDPRKYPTEASLRNMFSYRWTFRVFAPPSEQAMILPPDVYKEEMERFKQDINKMREMTLNAVGNAMLERVKSLSEQCQNGAVRSNTVEAVKRFLERFDEVFSGFVTNEKIQKLIADVKECMDGTDAAMLSVDDGFRNAVGSKMQEVVKEIATVEGLQMKRGFEI
jgi:hypothetical protein